MVRRFAFVAAVAVALVAVPSARADVRSPIGPEESFAGLVNDTAGTAVIRMACVGPLRPGQLGRPVPGQTVDVSRRLFDTIKPDGFTGAATAIRAFPRFVGQTGPTAIPTLAVFRLYDSPQTLPTFIVLPCSGDGQIVFEPLDGGTTARPSIVKVTFRSEP